LADSLFWLIQPNGEKGATQMETWSRHEWLTLRLGPVWVLSALVGRSRFHQLEREAFWRAVDDAARDHLGLARQLMYSVIADREWLFDEFELDDRPIGSGLSQVVTLLERADAASSAETRHALEQVGHDIARARGPFGQQISSQDAQMLQLVAQMLESMSETVENNPLNSHLPL
jgi:hypothetical protein